MMQQTQMTPNQQGNANQPNSMQQQPPTPNSQNQSQNTPQAVTPQLTPSQQNQMIPTPQPPSLPQQVNFKIYLHTVNLFNIENARKQFVFQFFEL